jgi:hypothetical protein
VSVKTPALKNWFGDWELTGKLKELKNTQAKEITPTQAKTKQDIVLPPPLVRDPKGWKLVVKIIH